MKAARYWIDIKNGVLIFVILSKSSAILGV
jgi:hypothetical protein